MEYHVSCKYSEKNKYKSSNFLYYIIIVYDDIDGIPLEKETNEDILPSESLSGKSGSSKAPAFIPSKWETVDPEQVAEQAVTICKWDSLDPPDPPKYDSLDLEEDYDEIKRKIKREIEVKTMQYQDALESGESELKPGWTISEQVEYYRKKLLKKVRILYKKLNLY